MKGSLGDVSAEGGRGGRKKERREIIADRL